MLKFIMQTVDEKLLFPYRYNKLMERIIPLLSDVGTILDVGTGDGHLAHHLMQVTDCEIVGLDVCLQPHSYIQVHHYDGGVFPFPDNSFDCVLMVDMLHHTTDIDHMVAEAQRVARKCVIIKDHYWNNRWDVVTLHVADYIGNIPYNVPLPYNYLRLREWESLFTRHKLAEISRATFKYSPLEPAHHVMVKLQTEQVTIPEHVNGKSTTKQTTELVPLVSPNLQDMP